MTSSFQRITIVVALFASVAIETVYAQDNPTTDLQDLETFIPRKARTEADEDRILSSTRFAEGRLLFRREKYADALQRYQRAYRYSNGSGTILAEIVPLAFRLGRDEEAAQYAGLLADSSNVDPFVLRRLAVLLTEQERFEEAARLYEITAKLPEGEDLEGAAVITQFELGRIYFLNEEYEKACDAFDRVIAVMETAKKGTADAAAIEALLKQPEVTYSVMGESSFLANRFDQAESYFRKAHTNKKAEPLLAFHLARIAFKRDQVEESRRQLQIYLDAEENSAGTSPYQLFADLLAADGKHDELIERLNTLREQQPANVFLGYFLANQLLEAEQFEQAAEIFEQVLKEQPSVDAYQGLTKCYVRLGDDERLLQILGQTISDLNGLSQVEEELQPLIEKPDSITRLAELGRQRFGEEPQDGQRAEAIALASLAILSEQFDISDEFYRLVAGEAPRADAQVWIAWGLELLLADQPKLAAKLFQEMLDERIPGRRSGEVLYYLSGALALNNEFDKALEAAVDGAARSKGIPAIEMRPAWVLYLSQQWDEAKEAYLEFLERYEDDYKTGGARAAVRDARMTLSNICVLQEEYAEGMEWLERVLDEYPNSIGAHNDLGYLWADQGIRLERALKMARKAVAAEPDNAAYLDSLGWALYRLGRYDEALVPLQKAIAIESPDPIILDHLADVMQQSGDVEQARKIWQQALDKLSDEQAKETKAD